MLRGVSPASALRSSRRRSGERFVIGRKIVERDVVSANKAQFFEVRIRETPAAPLIDPGAVRKHASQRAFRLHLANAFDLGIEHPLLSPLAFAGDEPQRACRRPPNSSSERPSGPAARDGRQSSGAQQRDKQEVIKVAGLQCSVLPIVGKAEQLASLRRQCRAVAIHPAQCARHQEGRGGATSFRRQARQVC